MAINSCVNASCRSGVVDEKDLIQFHEPKQGSSIHKACKVCAEEYLRTNQTCPVCQTPFGESLLKGLDASAQLVLKLANPELLHLGHQTGEPTRFSLIINPALQNIHDSPQAAELMSLSTEKIDIPAEMEKMMGFYKDEADKERMKTLNRQVYDKTSEMSLNLLNLMKG